MPQFDNIQYLAKLSGTWTDISSDVLQGTTSGSWGLSGNGPLDLMGKPERFQLTLKNNTGKYYPDGPSPLAGWGYGTEIKIIFTFQSISICKGHGWIIDPNYKLGLVTNADTITIVLGGWTEYASRTKIVSPATALSLRSDTALAGVTLLNTIQPEQATYDAGTQTFPVVFDSNTTKSTWYSEAVKIVLSELGRCYLRYGEYLGGDRLVFESASRRDSGTNLSIPTPLSTSDTIDDSDDDPLLFSDDTPMLFTEYATISTLTAHREADAQYGKKIINRIQQTVYPKAIDTEPHVCCALKTPLYLAAGATTTIKIPYTDQETGRKINVVTSSMLTPVAPGATDANLQVGINFNGNLTDVSGHVTMTDAGIDYANDYHVDGYGNTDVSSPISGMYGMYGGYGSFYTYGTSSYFDITSPCWYMSFWVNFLDVTAGKVVLTRNSASGYPGYLLGYSDGTNLLAYMSSNGTSFDLANGKSFGKINKSRWVFYEAFFDNGWWTLRADKQITDRWYNATLPTTGGTFSIGNSGVHGYSYMGFDRLCIRKDFPLSTETNAPTLDIKSTLDGDYWMNTASDASGTDLSASLTISVSYGSEAAQYTLTNASGSNAYIYVQGRGYRITAYDTVDKVYEDIASQDETWNVRELQIAQKYQQTPDNSATRLQAIITDYSDPQMLLERVKFCANRDETLMWAFLLGDIGDRVPLAHTPSGIAGNHWINAIEYTIDPGGIVWFTWTTAKDI